MQIFSDLKWLEIVLNILKESCLQGKHNNPFERPRVPISGAKKKLAAAVEPDLMLQNRFKIAHLENVLSFSHSWS